MARVKLKVQQKRNSRRLEGEAGDRKGEDVELKGRGSKRGRDSMEVGQSLDILSIETPNMREERSRGRNRRRGEKGDVSF